MKEMIIKMLFGENPLIAALWFLAILGGFLMYSILKHDWSTSDN